MDPIQSIVSENQDQEFNKHIFRIVNNCQFLLGMEYECLRKKKQSLTLYFRQSRNTKTPHAKHEGISYIHYHCLV